MNQESINWLNIQVSENLAELKLSLIVDLVYLKELNCSVGFVLYLLLLKCHVPSEYE